MVLPPHALSGVAQLGHRRSVLIAHCPLFASLLCERCCYEWQAHVLLNLSKFILSNSDASFAEALYGLRRTPVEISSTSVPLRGDLGDAGSSPLTGRRPFTGRQRAASVLFLVYNHLNLRLLSY